MEQATVTEAICPFSDNDEADIFIWFLMKHGRLARRKRWFCDRKLVVAALVYEPKLLRVTQCDGSQHLFVP